MKLVLCYPYCLAICYCKRLVLSVSMWNTLVLVLVSSSMVMFLVSNSEVSRFWSCSHHCLCVYVRVCVCSATGGYPVLKFRHTEWTNTSVLSLIELDHLVHESVLVGEVLVFVRSEQRINHRHVVALHRFDQRRSTVRHRLVQLRTFLHHTKNIRRNKQMLAQL